MIGKDGQVVLSTRLQMLADMVGRGNRLVDVGCDHGFLSIYLVQQGICPTALALDVRKGPLAAASAHVRECGLGDYIETRLSDGLLAYNAGEAETMVCAGMGGPLMSRILADSFEKAKQLKEFILQPQSEIGEFRRFLRVNGFAIVEENAVIDEGKYYFAMKCIWTGVAAPMEYGASENDSAVEKGMPKEHKADVRKLYDAYGERLLLDRNPIQKSFLENRRDSLTRLREQLLKAESDKAKQRLPEVERELSEIAQALLYFE